MRAKAMDTQLGTEEMYSAIPLLDGLKTLISSQLTDGSRSCDNWGMEVWDVSRAHLNDENEHVFYTTLPDGHARKSPPD